MGRKKSTIPGAIDPTEPNATTEQAVVDAPTDNTPREPIIDRDDTTDGVGESAGTGPSRPAAAEPDDTSDLPAPRDTPEPLRRFPDNDRWTQESVNALVPPGGLSVEEILADLRTLAEREKTVDAAVAKTLSDENEQRRIIGEATRAISRLQSTRQELVTGRNWARERSRRLKAHLDTLQTDAD